MRTLNMKARRMYLEQISLFTILCILGISGSALHGPCETNDDCGTIDTHCRNGTCACNENFAVWFDTCLSLPEPRVQCHKKHDCHTVLGVKSMCTKKMQCACKPFHHLHMGQCVKNRDLNDICDQDHQCYCGAGCEDKIRCLAKTCTCNFGHKPYKSRRCIEDPLKNDGNLEAGPNVIPLVSKMRFSSKGERYIPNNIFSLLTCVLIML